MISHEGLDLDEISVIFCSDEYLLDVNRQYLNHDYYTDVITFSYAEHNQLNGDIFISVDRVKENAVIFDSSFIKELYRVIIHGVLHLMKYVDKTEEDKEFMRKKEEFYLEWLGL